MGFGGFFTVKVFNWEYFLRDNAAPMEISCSLFIVISAHNVYIVHCVLYMHLTDAHVPSVSRVKSALCIVFSVREGVVSIND